jgi:plastocyanin
MFKLILIIALLLFTTIITFPAAYAEDVITIIPCSSDRNNSKFFDLTSDYVRKGQQVRWFNSDDINHRIIISTSDNKKQVVSDSGLIKPNSSFSFKFNNPGMYDFSSPIYPWMKGNISVTNDLSSEIKTNPKNNVSVQLSWSPATPKVGQLTHFKIVFLHNNTTINQPHVDYVFSLVNSTTKTVYQQGLHSSWGVESASYKFGTKGLFTPKVTITAILFQPVEPTESDFKIIVTA